VCAPVHKNTAGKFRSSPGWQGLLCNCLLCLACRLLFIASFAALWDRSSSFFFFFLYHLDVENILQDSVFFKRVPASITGFGNNKES
jgi:hypothetical protein